MPEVLRPFDIRPTLIILCFSLILTGSLIIVESAASTDVAAEPSSRVLTGGDPDAESAALADADAGAFGPRQLRAPNDGELPAASRQLAEASDLAPDPGDDGSDGGDVDTLAAAPRTTVTTIATTTSAAPVAQPSTTAGQVTATTRFVTTTTRAERPAPTTTTSRPRSTTTTTRAATTTTTRPATTTTTTTQAPPPVNGRYSVAQIIDGTISNGDGSNPNEEAPMGRHDASLYLVQGWNWAQGPTRNGAWGLLGQGAGNYAEWRCAVIPEYGHEPPVPFRINVRRGAYYQFANGNWNKAFDANLTNGHRGGYLGNAGVLNSDPFTGGGHHGQIQWRREADGSYSAPWNANALMMHFWAGQRRAPAPGQTAEFLTSEVRLQQPDGQTVDLSRVRVLFQCGIDYYSSTGGQGTKVPGPGIGKYHRVTTGWTPGLWVTLPRNVAANSVADFRNWLEANLPPDVRP